MRPDDSRECAVPLGMDYRLTGRYQRNFRIADNTAPLAPMLHNCIINYFAGRSGKSGSGMFDQYDLALLIFGIVALGFAVFATYTGEALTRFGQVVRREKNLFGFGDKLRFST